VFDSLYSTGERDKFRTRVERTPNGTEVYVSHKGLEEVYSGDRKETTVWQPRKADPLLEGEMLQRLMVKLGYKEEAAKTAIAATGSAPPAARARIVQGQPGATLQVDDAFDRAWRRVGLALDRSGFTVEDRDRAKGLYFVRYVDPKRAGKDEPGFLSKLFSFGKKEEAGGPAKYRVSVKGEGDRSTVTVLDASGAPENGEAGKQIVGLLVEDLK
jgi:outer membrane protein assembly factor BamC